MIVILANLWLWILAFAFVLILSSFFFKDKYKIIEAQPALTVVIAIWNEGPRIRRCVESILANEYPKDKFSILVVGGGEDNTLEVCKQLENEGKIRFIPEYQRGGKWRALNKAIDEVKTEEIAFTDGDYIVDKNWLKELIRHSEGVDIVVGSIWTLTKRTFSSRLYVVYHAFFDPIFSTASKFFGATFFIGQNSLVKKHVFDKLRFKKSQVEDLRFVFEAHKLGFKTRRIREAKAFTAVPASVNDFRIELVRVMEGLYGEMLSQGNIFALVFLFVNILCFVSWPFTVYYLLKTDPLTWISISAVLVLFFLNCVALKIKHEREIFGYVIYTLPLFIMSSLSSVEAVLRLLFKKPLGWPTLNKIID
jgi:cellulose synthase/poly-beta-1,6-N-acetylglucosamine synthase-like glycosyltransferase